MVDSYTILLEQTSYYGSMAISSATVPFIESIYDSNSEPEPSCNVLLDYGMLAHISSINELEAELDFLIELDLETNGTNYF